MTNKTLCPLCGKQMEEKKNIYGEVTLRCNSYGCFLSKFGAEYDHNSIIELREQSNLIRQAGRGIKIDEVQNNTILEQRERIVALSALNDQLTDANREHNERIAVLSKEKDALEERCAAQGNLITKLEAERGKEQVFINHIHRHLKYMGITSHGGQIICKICDKTVEEIYQKEGKEYHDENARLQKEKDALEIENKRVILYNQNYNTENARLQKEKDTLEAEKQILDDDKEVLSEMVVKEQKENTRLRDALRVARLAFIRYALSEGDCHTGEISHTDAEEEIVRALELPADNMGWLDIEKAKKELEGK